MNIIEDEIIGELRYLTTEFDQVELLQGSGGVISQGAVRRYFEKKCPDLKVKKCGGLKLDSQRNIVTMRIGVVKEKVPVIEQQKFNKALIDMNEAVGNFDRVPGEQKLLSPGYDELKAKYDKLQHEKDITGRLYDALVMAVSKDAQKFADLLVENDEIKAKCVTFQREYDAIVVLYDKLEIRYSKLIEKYDTLVAAIDPDPDAEEITKAAAYDALIPPAEDATDLIEAKKAIAEDDAIDLDVLEDEINGPFSESIPFAEEFIEAAHEVLADPKNHLEMTGADGSKIEGEKSENAGCGERKNHIKINGQDVEFDEKLEGGSSE